MTTQTPTPVHKAVQEFYGSMARTEESCCQPASDDSESCCGSGSPGENIQNELYPQELLKGIPLDVANFTAGSGDPISLAKLQPGEHVLDLGSGGGLDCFLAARLVGETGYVIGVDMTAEMLARARAQAARLDLKHVEFREGYLEALPVEDESVDVVISNCVINLSPEKPQVFREIFRVLKPGGRIAISDMVANHPLPETARQDKEKWCGCTSGALERKNYADELTRAGFVDVLLEPNVASVVNALESGRIQSPKAVTKEELLNDLHLWEGTKKTMVVPHNISARKPDCSVPLGGKAVL